MSKIEQDINRSVHSFSVNPELGFLGLNSQEIESTAQKAQNIALWTTLKEKIESFADFKGQEGSRIRQRTLILVGGLALIASAVACGGGEKANASTSSTTSKAETPVATEVRTPVSAPRAEVTPNPTVVKTPEPVSAVTTVSSLPPEAQKYIEGINSIGAIPDTSKEIVRNSFVRDIEKAKAGKNDFQRSEPYRNLYSTLGSAYNQRRSPEILVQMDGIEQYIKATWPELYQQLLDGGKFIREGK